MRAAERRTQGGEVLWPGATPVVDRDVLAPPVETPLPPRAMNMLVPLGVMVTVGRADAVIVIGTQWGRGGHSGVEVSAGYAGLFEVRDDKVVRVRTYAKRDEALEAAGLRE